MNRSYTTAFVVSFFFPLIGIVFGMVLYLRDDHEAQGAGVTCILLSVVGLVAWGFAWGFLSAFLPHAVTSRPVDPFLIR